MILTDKDEKRFFEKVLKHSGTDGCWEWTASKDTKGYGQFSVKSEDDKFTTRLAHRVSFRIKTGEWPKDNILHKCDNPKCVNPDHLFEGTQQDNISDAWKKGRAYNPGIRQSAKTHCPNGHLYSGDNLYLAPNGGGRFCRKCKNETWKRWYMKNKDMA